jgi:hypothetical protein
MVADRSKCPDLTPCYKNAIKQICMLWVFISACNYYWELDLTNIIRCVSVVIQFTIFALATLTLYFHIVQLMRGRILFCSHNVILNNERISASANPGKLSIPPHLLPAPLPPLNHCQDQILVHRRRLLCSPAPYDSLNPSKRHRPIRTPQKATINT